MNLPAKIVVAALAMLGVAAGVRGSKQDPGGAQVGEPSFVTAIAEYRAGRFEAAFHAFEALVAARGSEAEPELLVDLGLAALRVQRIETAEQVARRLAASAAVRDRADGAFLTGHAAFLRALRAEAAARLQDAEPGAWDAALRSARAAIEAWLQADALSGGWPAAVRDAERAARKLAELQRQADEAERNKPAAKHEPDQPQPKSPNKPDEPPEEQKPEVLRTQMSPPELARLLDRLQQKEREKRLARQARQSTGNAEGARDW